MARLGPAPFALETNEGRGWERDRRVGLSSLAIVCMRASTAIATVAMVPVLVHLLGSEGFGLWFTVTSATSVVGFADLGISNGLVTLVAAASAHDADDEIASYVASAFFALTALGVGLFGLFLLVSHYVDWAHLLNASIPQRGAVRSAVLALALSICLALPLGVAQRVHLAFQEGFLSSLYTGLGVMFGLAFALVASIRHAEVNVVVAATVAGPVLASALNFGVLFGHQKRRFLPRWRSATPAAAAQVVRFGGLFLVLGLAVAIGYESDLVVLARVLGPRAVTAYAVPMRLFGLTPMLVGFLLTPLWPAYGEAVARGDVAWARATFRRSLVVAGALNIPVAILLVAIGRPVVHRLVGHGVAPSIGLLLGLGAWSALSTINVPFAMFLNGVHVVRLQVVCATLMAATNLPLSIVLAHAIGIPGPILATVLTSLTCILIPDALYLRRYLRRLGIAGPEAANMAGIDNS
jgi:O-antigen/teichoic acid export membrane protein